MVGEDKKYIRTWEELMMDRLAQAFRAKDQDNPELFDNILEEMEMLLKLVPQMHNELEAIKSHKISLLKEGVKKVEARANTCPDDVTKRFVYQKEVYVLEWDYRTDLLDTVISIMGAYQKIPFSQTETNKTELTAIKPVEPKPAENVQKASIEGKPIEKTPEFPVT